MTILKNGGIKIIIMNTKLKAILGLTSISLLIYTTYEQNKAINSQKFEINALKKSIEHIDSAASNQYDELFEAQTRAAKYEIALELLEEQDRVAAKKFKHILENETE
jgi:hypothetical protein